MNTSLWCIACSATKWSVLSKELFCTAGTRSVKIKVHSKRVEKMAQIHSKRVEKVSKYTRNERRRCQNTLETSGEDVKIHSKRVGKMYFLTTAVSLNTEDWFNTLSTIILLIQSNNQWQSNTLKLHSKRVEKMQNYTRNGLGRCKTTLETRGEDVKQHSKRVGKM